MTGRLIKYEFRSIVKMMSIVWTALPAMALISAIFGQLTFGDARYDDTPFFADMMGAVSIFLFGGIFMAMIAVNILVILLRFYRGLLKDEGYLMHTLPVKTWQLITAKGVVAACVTLISILVAGLSILLLTAFEGSFAGFGRFIVELFRAYGEEPVYILISLEILVLIIAYGLASIYRAYAAMSIGQLAKRHKILLSVGAYLGIGVAGMILIAVVGQILDLGVFDGLIDVLMGWMHGFSVTDAVQAGLIALIVISVVETVIFHIISEQILRKKLNLE